MKAMAQKRISDFFNMKSNKQAKIIKYCISQGTNETEDREDEVICLNAPERVGKISEKT